MSHTLTAPSSTFRTVLETPVRPETVIVVSPPQRKHEDVVHNLRIVGIAWIATMIITLSGYVAIWTLFGR